MDRAPLVTAFVASYNHAPFLEATLDSMLGQDYPALEVVLVDDGSTDESLEIARAVAQRDSRLRVFQHPGGVNRGISPTCNLALEHARGDLLAWIGSDDLWHPAKTKLQVAIFEEHPDVGMVYARARPLGSEGPLDAAPRGGVIGRGLPALAALISGNRIPASTVMFRRKCIEQVGSFADDVLYSDWELWMRIVARWEPFFLDRPLADYRYHEDNVSLGVDSRTTLERLLAALDSIENQRGTVGGRLGEARIAIRLALQRALLTFALDRDRESRALTRHALELAHRRHRNEVLFWLLDVAWRPPGAALELETLTDYCDVLTESWNPSARVEAEKLSCAATSLWHGVRSHRAKRPTEARRHLLTVATGCPRALMHPPVRRLALEYLVPFRSHY